MTQVDPEELAKVAYHAYGGVTDFKNYQGLPMPAWENLTPTIREAWKASVMAVWTLARSGRVTGGIIK